MLRKILFLFSAAVLFLASGAAPVFAKESPPTMQNVFTPAVDAQIYAVQEFKSVLYVAVSDETHGGQIWRSKDGNSWEAATGLGFGVSPRYTTSWGMSVFKGKLYAAANCYTPQGAGCPGMILRSANGKDWEQIPLATGIALLDKIGVAGDSIYATSVMPGPVGSGAQIWRSRSGDPTSWEVVNQLEAGVNSSSAPTEYKGQVYLTGYASGASMLIWHSADGGRDNWATTTLKVTDKVVDPNSDFLFDGELIVYKGDLYFCEANSIDGGTIYRSKDGTNWEKVINPNPLDVGFLDMIQYNGDLYANVFSWSNNGMRLWRSHSGDLGSWEVVTVDPADWGDGHVAWRGTSAVLKGSLYVNSGPSMFRMNTH